jgi:hypothetical protein
VGVWVLLCGYIATLVTVWPRSVVEEAR